MNKLFNKKKYKMNNILVLLLFLVTISSCQISENSFSKEDILRDTNFINLMIIRKNSQLSTIDGKYDKNKIENAILLMEQNGDTDPCKFKEYHSQIDKETLEWFSTSCEFYQLFHKLKIDYGNQFSEKYPELCSEFDEKNPNLKINPLEILNIKKM